MRRSSSQQISSICRRCLLGARVSSTHPVSKKGVLLPAAREIGRRNGLQYSTRRWNSTVPTASATDWPGISMSQKPREISEPSHLANVVEDSLHKFQAVDGVPTKQLTTAALQSCLKAAATLHPQLKRAERQSRASASKLATLGAERTGQKLPIDEKIQDAINTVSYAAYQIITSPNVDMLPEYLRLYVHIQNQLGRPESLPRVFEMFATKAKPTVKDGQVAYVKRNPGALDRAIDAEVTELALQTAIDAKHLDSALGIIEAGYVVPVFKLQKVIRNCTVPAIGVASLPFGIWALSTAYAAYWQNTMDMSTATAVAVMGISGYCFVVGSLGLTAKVLAKDHMKRVTWTPGTPLRSRYLREEERAALDKVACAWGFRETWRHGEETGPEWEGLKEYMGYRDMLLDRVEFMEGMS